MKKVKIYSAPSCIFCKMVKEFFDEKGVKYEEIDVSVDLKAQEEAYEKSGQKGVPVLDIEGKIIIGFDEDAIAEELSLEL